MNKYHQLLPWKIRIARTVCLSQSRSKTTKWKTAPHTTNNTGHINISNMDEPLHHRHLFTFLIFTVPGLFRLQFIFLCYFFFSSCRSGSLRLGNLARILNSLSLSHYCGWTTQLLRSISTNELALCKLSLAGSVFFFSMLGRCRCCCCCCCGGDCIYDIHDGKMFATNADVLSTCHFSYWLVLLICTPYFDKGEEEQLQGSKRRGRGQGKTVETLHRYDSFWRRQDLVLESLHSFLFSSDSMTSLCSFIPARQLFFFF